MLKLGIHLLTHTSSILLIGLLGALTRTVAGKLIVQFSDNSETIRLYKYDTLTSSSLFFLPFAFIIYLIFVLFRKMLFPQSKIRIGIVTGLLSALLLFILSNVLTITRPGITVGVTIGCLCVLIMGLASPYFHDLSKKIFHLEK